MEQNHQNKSTYSAIFATLLIIFIIVAIAYSTIKRVADNRQKIREEQIHKNIVVEGLPENESLLSGDVILYENLTNEEAAKMIDQLLKSGEKNLKKLERLETEILEE